MIEIGRIQSLQIHHIDANGAWLQAGTERVLLPGREVPPEPRPGAFITVFVYRDASGLPVATLRQPLAQVGEFALLRVSQVNKIGAFLDWGLEKELLVPYSEQPERMRAGRRYLIKICLDDRGRVVGTGKIDRCLETEDIPLKVGDAVDLQVWEFTSLGAKVIVNDLYAGLLYQDEIRTRLQRGDRLKGFVKLLREDHKIDVTLHRSGKEGVDEGKAAVLAALKDKPFLPLHDSSDPGEIQRTLGMSKKTFKKAIGGLYKAGIIELSETGIRLKEKPQRLKERPQRKETSQ